MLYLLDANVLIDASRDYYQFDRVPEFWEWLVEAGANGHVKIPLEVYEEIKDGKSNEDALATWAKDKAVEDALLLQEESDPKLVGVIVDEGYAPDLTDDEVEEIGRDPFLISYALLKPLERCVVTTEVSKPNKKRANRKLPDVCRQFNVHCCHSFDFIKKADFKTKRK